MNFLVKLTKTAGWCVYVDGRLKVGGCATEKRVLKVFEDLFGKVR